MGKTKKIILIIIVLIILGITGWLAVDYFLHWRGEKQVEMLAKSLEKYQQDLFNKKAADKIGGKTPQETLQMFIDAVEKGDYELASKYLILENQISTKEELTALKEKNNLESFLNILKNAKSDGNIEGNYFRMKSKTDLGPYYFISFVLYPSGNWKIEEI